MAEHSSPAVDAAWTCSAPDRRSLCGSNAPDARKTRIEVLVCPCGRHYRRRWVPVPAHLRGAIRTELGVGVRLAPDVIAGVEGWWVWAPTAPPRPRPRIEHTEWARRQRRLKGAP